MMARISQFDLLPSGRTARRWNDEVQTLRLKLSGDLTRPTWDVGIGQLPLYTVLSKPLVIVVIKHGWHKIHIEHGPLSVSYTLLTTSYQI